MKDDFYHEMKIPTILDSAWFSGQNETKPPGQPSLRVASDRP